MSLDLTVPEPQAEANELEAEAAAEAASRKGRPASGAVARAALILMVGTVLSRILGLGREMVIAYLFGGGSAVDAFTIANHVATIIYDLLIAGTVSAALVPVFTEYASDDENRSEFGKVVSSILTVAGLFLILSVGVLEIFAGPLVGFMGAGFTQETQDLALTMTRWVLPGVFFMGLSGVVMATHYSLGRFVFPAFTSAAFNACIIFCAISLAGIMDVKSLVLGMVVGAFGMLALQLPGLRDVPLRPRFDFSHPAVRKIFKLYAPVGLSVVVSSAALIIDRSLASRTGEGSISAMRYATTLVQFALGMVAAAISLAALPSLSQHFNRQDSEAFRRTLSGGLRMVTVFVLPAAALLLALAQPIVELLFRHGAFDAQDQDLTVQALRFYVPGLPFGAIDQVLIFAFYARKNTVTPVLVGIAAVGVYLSVALSTIDTLGMRGLVLANSVQLIFHAIVTGVLLWYALRKESGPGGNGVGVTVLKAGASAALMALVCYGAWLVLSSVMRPDSLLAEAVLLGVPTLLGGSLYVALVWMMRLPEVELVVARARRRLKR